MKLTQFAAKVNPRHVQIPLPMIGGLITSTIRVLVVTPILFSWMKERALTKGTLEMSKMFEGLSTSRRPSEAGWIK